MNRRDVLRALTAAPLAALAPKLARADWDERKLFTVTGSMERMLWSELFACWDKGTEAPEPVLRLARVFQASTKTPDIAAEATVTILGKNDDFPTSTFKTSVAKLFNKPQKTLCNLILCSARDVVAKQNPAPEHANPVRYLTTLIQEGAIDEALKNLGFVEVEFFYFGPPPYPQDGRIYSFDYGVNKWKPLRRAG